MKRKAKSVFTVLLTALLVFSMLPTTAFAASSKKVPAKVSITKVTASTNAVTVKWKKAKNATAYRIYYKQSNAKKWVAVANVSGSKTSYTHKNSKKTPLVGGKKYSYTVRAYNKSSKKWGSYSAAKTITIPAVPGTVKIKSVKALAYNKVSISWNKVSNATSYRVYYKKSGASKWSTVADVTGTSYTHTSNKKAALKENSKYVYTVRAYNKSSKKWGSYNTKGVSVSVPKKPVHKHNYDEGVLTKIPTCTTDGVKTYTCKDCGATKTEVVKATGHSYDNGVVTTEPTCTSTGVKTFTCEDCGATKTESIPTTDAHQYDEGTITTPATCTTDGVKTFTCTICGSTKTEAIKATGHNYDEGVVTTEPTCSKKGVKTFTCKTCGDTYTESIAATGNHNFDDGVITKEATCKSTGEKTYTCKDCGATKTETIAKTDDHHYDEGVVKREPTCTKVGLMLYTCKDCGATKREDIAMVDHTWEDDYEDVYESHVICNGCGKDFTAEYGPEEAVHEAILHVMAVSGDDCKNYSSKSVKVGTKLVGHSCSVCGKKDY